VRLLQNCVAGYTGFCLTVNPGFAGGAYGYVAMGLYKGGQAEYLRVPYADFNCLKLPRDARRARAVCARRSRRAR
jgi:glutathione-independent formaldehyde dehydrogenase